MSDTAPPPGHYSPDPTRRAEAEARQRAAAEDARKLATDPLEANPNVAILDPLRVAVALWQAYGYDTTISRTINQLVEQGTGDAEVRPEIGNEAVNAALAAWWRTNHMDLRIRPAFKQFAISGEQWHYLPLRADGTIPLRELVPWNVYQIDGRSWTDWNAAKYLRHQDGSEGLDLTPANTTFFAHDALFGNLRGMTPFATMLFAARRYRRFLDGRERVNRLAGIVTGKLRFENVQDAAAVLGWPLDENGNPIPQKVYVPEEGTMVVTIGAGDFGLETPNVAGGAADPDGQRFYLRIIEGGRLPEYASGNGANVNVATATVQYPFAVRFILALRDEFEYAMTATIRMVLARMVRLGFIPAQWTAVRPDDTTEVETPESAVVSWSFPEIRELDFQAHFDSILALVKEALLSDERAMQLLGYDPEKDMPPPEERERRRQSPFANLAQPPDGDGDGEEGDDANAEALQQALRTVMMQMLARSSRDDAPTP